VRNVTGVQTCALPISVKALYLYVAQRYVPETLHAAVGTPNLSGIFPIISKMLALLTRINKYQVIDIRILINTVKQHIQQHTKGRIEQIIISPSIQCSGSTFIFIAVYNTVCNKLAEISLIGCMSQQLFKFLLCYTSLTILLFGKFLQALLQILL